MRVNTSDLALTALAPAIWGSTYVVTTQFLNGYSPVSVALLRSLPAGLLLLLAVRKLPAGIWWLRVFVLGALNFALFLTLLFVAAYRLPGGVAATVGSVQPLLVIFAANRLLGMRIRLASVVTACVGTIGVSLLVLTARAVLDPVGIGAGLGAACCMALGTVLSRKWQPPASALVFTAWQLTAGGCLLLPYVLVFEPAIPIPTPSNLFALAWLGVVGMAMTYVLWLRGIRRLSPTTVSSLLLVSPVTAVALGWVVLDQELTIMQGFGGLLVACSIWFAQRANRTSVSATPPGGSCSVGTGPAALPEGGSHGSVIAAHPLRDIG